MFPQKFLYVYILRCSDNSYYTGITNNAEQRLAQHNNGSVKSAYTFNRRPVEMVFCQRFNDYELAISYERKIKGWSRAKKNALIEKNWDKLKDAAKCNNNSSHQNLIVSKRVDP